MLHSYLHPKGLTKELVTSALSMFDMDKTDSIDVKDFGALFRAMGLVCLFADCASPARYRLHSQR